MIKKKVVYCEMDFLQEFLNSYPLFEPNDESLRLVDAWMSFYQFFCKADIVLNISASEFKSLTNNSDWLRRIWKKSIDNQCGLEFEKDSFPDISLINGENADNKVLNAVFLTTKKDEICNEKAKELGVFVFNPEMAKHCNHLFCDSGTAFPDEKAKDWNFMRGLTGPKVRPPLNISNSMLVIDNYLLCDDADVDFQKKIDYNLKPIFQNLLPLRLAEDETYDISFFVGARSESSHLYDAQYNYLHTMIQKLRKDLKFSLNIFIGKQDKFHDRSIVTNNVLINSGHGFGVLRKDGETNTPTSVNIVFPFFQTKIAWCDNTYLNIIQTAKKIVDRLHQPNINCWGEYEKVNKLISYYNPPKNVSSQPVFFSIGGDDAEHRNGRFIGKIDLSQIKDYRRKTYSRK